MKELQRFDAANRKPVTFKEFLPPEFLEPPESEDEGIEPAPVIETFNIFAIIETCKMAKTGLSKVYSLSFIRYDVLGTRANKNFRRRHTMSAH